MGDDRSNGNDQNHKHTARKYREALENAYEQLMRIGHPVEGISAQRGHDEAFKIMRDALK